MWCNIYSFLQYVFSWHPLIKTFCQFKSGYLISIIWIKCAKKYYMMILLQFIWFHCNSSKQVLNKVFLEHLNVKRSPSPHTELYKLYKLRITIHKPNQREFADSFLHNGVCSAMQMEKKCECKSNIILLQESTSLTKKFCTNFSFQTVWVDRMGHF